MDFRIKTFILLILMTSFLSFNSFAVPDGGVNYWNFDVLTDEWSSVTAINNGATSIATYPTFNETGDSSGKSFYFDRVNDYINSTLKTIYLENTYSFWVKTDTYETGVIVGVDGDSRFQLSHNFLLTDGDFRIYIKKDTVILIKAYFSIPDWNDNNWNNIIFTYNLSDGEFNVFFNSESVAVTYDNQGSSLSSFDLSSDLFIGANNKLTSTDNYYEDYLDEIQFYNKILNQTEIENIYNIGVSVPPLANSTPDYLIQFENLTVSEDKTFNFNVNYSKDSSLISGFCNYSINNLNLINYYNVSKSFNNLNVDSYQSTFKKGFNDTILFSGCFESLPSSNVNIIFKCENATQTKTLNYHNIPLCSFNNQPFKISSSVCSGDSYLNVTINNTELNKLYIQNLTFIRNYQNQTFNLSFNETSKTFYDTNLLYQKNGNYSGFFSCYNNTENNTQNLNLNIEVLNNPPVIFLNSLFVDNQTLYNFNVNDTFNFLNGFWNFYYSVFDNTLNNYQIKLYNSTPVLLNDYSGLELLEFNLNSSFINEFDNNPYNITLYAIDDEGLTSFKSFNFSVYDNVAPVCTETLTRSLKGQYYKPLIQCTDELLFNFNLTCSNGYTFYQDNILNESFTFNNIIDNLAEDPYLCALKVCDGHTSEKLAKDYKIKIDKKNSKKYNIQIDHKFKHSLEYKGSKDFIFESEQFRDRIKFKFNFMGNDKIKNDKNDAVETYTFIYTTSENSVYVPNSEYLGWIIDAKNDVWFDLNPSEIDDNYLIDVFKLNSTSYEITITAKSNYLSFESIGELNCLNFNYEIIPVFENYEERGTQEFTSVSQALFWILIIFLWLALVITLFTISGRNNNPIQIFNILQMITGIVIGLGFIQFSFIIGFTILLLSALIFVVMGMNIK